MEAGAFMVLLFCSLGMKPWGWRGNKALMDNGTHFLALVFRYNIPELAKKHKVFAIDLLGFGWSDKALVDYNAALWRDQVADFIRAKAGGQPVVLAGNRYVCRRFVVLFPFDLLLVRYQTSLVCVFFLVKAIRLL